MELNRALVDHSSELICYWDGRESGTKHTVKQAKVGSLTIRNLHEPPTKNSPLHFHSQMVK